MVKCEELGVQNVKVLGGQRKIKGLVVRKY